MSSKIMITHNTGSKRVNIYNVEKGIVMRTTRTLAIRLIAEGGWQFTSKGKLKSFLNKEGKLHRNMGYLARIEHITGEKYDKKNFDGKVIAVVPCFKFPVKYIGEDGKSYLIDEKSEPIRGTKLIIHKWQKFRIQFVHNTIKSLTKMIKTKKECNPRSLEYSGDKMLVLGFPE